MTRLPRGTLKRASTLPVLADDCMLDGRDASEELRIDNALIATREFFESMGVATRLSAYQLDTGIIPQVLAQLKQHNLTQLGEQRDINLEVSERILLRAI